MPSQVESGQGGGDGQVCAGKGDKVRAMLRARLGEDIYTSWFAAMEFESFDGRVVRATVPVKFLKSWIQSHYADDLLAVLCEPNSPAPSASTSPCASLAWQRPAGEANAWRRHQRAPPAAEPADRGAARRRRLRAPAS